MYVRYLLLLLCLLAFKFKFRLVAFYVNTKTNWFLDFIGRDIDFGWADAQELIQRDLVDAHMPGLVFEKMNALLAYLVGGDTVMKTLELPGDEPGGLGSRLHLSPMPGRRAVRGEITAKERREALLGSRCAAMCAGIGGIARGLVKLDLPLVIW